MTEETIKALAADEHRKNLKILEKHLGPDYFNIGYLHNKISDAMSEAALSGTEPFNGEEDEYVEKVKKIMEANETGVAEAIVDEIILPIKAWARQYWQSAQSKHEELLRLQADLNHNIQRCLEIAEERDKTLAALSGTEVKEVWEAVSVDKELPSIGDEVQISYDGGITWQETALYTDERTCMFAGFAGGSGYFKEGFATNGSTGCERGLILDKPTHWLKKTTAAIPPTERVECYLPVKTYEEVAQLPESDYVFSHKVGMLKKTVLTVVPNHQ